MRRFAPLVAAALVVVVGLAATGCGGGGDDRDLGTQGKRVKDLAVADLPGAILGLEVRSETVSAAVESVDSTYFDALGLWSLRTRPDKKGKGGDLVQATLQVSRFNDEARPSSAEFRNRVVNQIGSTKPKPFRLGGRTVHLTTGTKQSIAVWFRDAHLFVLATRADYETPRALLRALLEVEP